MPAHLGVRYEIRRTDTGSYEARTPSGRLLAREDSELAVPRTVIRRLDAESIRGVDIVTTMRTRARMAATDADRSAVRAAVEDALGAVQSEVEAPPFPLPARTLERLEAMATDLRGILATFGGVS